MLLNKIRSYLVNLPNILTVIRICLIPVIVVTFYVDYKFSKYMTIFIFVFASVTDYFDGLLARVLNARSEFGKIFDPIADKMLVASVFVMMVSQGIAPVIPIIVILCREILVSGMREYISELNLRVSVSVTSLAKIKTFAQMTSIVILLLSSIDEYAYFSSLGNALIWISAVLTVVTGYIYLKELNKKI